MLGLPLILATSISASLTPVLEAKAAARPQCGSGSSWDVKVGSDPQARQVDQTSPPTPRTIAQLTSLPLPSPIKHRVLPTETTVFVTTATMNHIRVEHDADTHIAIDDGTRNAATTPGHFMIAELPDIRCVPKTSPFYASIQRAHLQLSAWGGSTPVTARITGVGFFDGYTDQPEQAPNQIELHSVLNLNINPGSIAGQVTNSAGGAISGASVNDGVDPPVLTDTNGVYSILNVAANTKYSVTASASGFAAQSKSVTVSYGSASTANFNPTQSATNGAVTGTVTGASDGLAIPGATVSDSGGASASTDGSGAYTLSGLIPGRHTLTASAAGFASATQTTSVGAGTTNLNINFSLTPNTRGGPQFVQASGVSESIASSSLIATFSFPTSAGHLLVLSASVYTGTTNPITSVTDSGGNVWTKIGAFVVAGHNSDGEMWYSANARAATSVAVHTANPAMVSMEVQEFSGVATSSPLDVSTGISNTGTSASSGTMPPMAGTDLVVGFVAGHANGQAINVTAAGFISQGQQTSNGGGSSIASLVTGYRVPTSPGDQMFTATFSSAMYWAAAIVSFKAGP